MKPIRTSLSRGALVLALGTVPGLADDVTMVTANESWLNPNVWSDNAAPSVANDYFTAVTGNNVLRSSPEGTTAGGSTDFPGNSLTVIAGTRFALKQEDGETAAINGGAGNLILDGGRVSFGPNNGDHNPTLDVNEFRVTTTAGALLDVNLSTVLSTVDGTLIGDGDLLIDFENAPPSTGRTISFAAVDPTYSGKITVTEGMILDFGSDVDFTAAGGSLELTDTAQLNVDQNITIDGGKLVDANGFVSGGVYTGTDITDLGPNFADGGGTLTVTNTDSDNDGLNDFWEDEHFGDMSGTVEPSDLTAARGTEAQDPALGANWDNDSDGADNETEESVGTDPNLADTDMDGLDDGPEIDGSLNAYDEFGDLVGAGNGGAPTDPFDADSDDDGILDLEEVTEGEDFWITDPNSDDTDQDFLPDTWEILVGLDPTDDSGDNGDFGDPDEDFLDNFGELEAGTDPFDADSDDDTVSDFDEVSGNLNPWNLGVADGPPGEETNPLAADSDGDGLDDGEEITAMTDPNNKDSDGDSFPDPLELANDSDPTDPLDFPAGFISIAASVEGVTDPAAASDGTGVLLTTADFDMNGGNAVALIVTSEGLGGSGILTATFAGQEMESLTATQGPQSASIFYLVDPAVTVGAFVVTTAPNLMDVQLAYSYISLGSVPGVAAQVTVTSTTDDSTIPLELSYTTPSDDALVIGAAVNNDFNDARQLSIAPGGNPDTDLLSHTVPEGASSGHFHTYGRAGLAGSQTDGYLGQYQRTAIASIVFSVPDLDGDGLEDSWENLYFGNLTDARATMAQDPALGADWDNDNDGADNGQEQIAGTDPTLADTDNDGLSDGDELTVHGTDPLNRDSDGDSYGDGVEVNNGGDPKNPSVVPPNFIEVVGTADPVTVDNTGPSVGADGVLFTSASFDMGVGANAVALLVTTEGAGDSSIRSATFAGQAMEGVDVEDNGAGAQTASIFYLINPTTTVGAFEFILDADYGGTVDYAYTPISLSNVASVADMATARSTSDDNGTPLDLSYATGSDDGFVLGAAVNNDFDYRRILSIDYGNPNMDLLPHTIPGPDGANASSGHFHTFGRVGPAGSYTDGYLGQYDRTAIATLVFGTPAAAPSGIDVVSAAFTGEGFAITYDGLDTGTSYQLEISSPGLDNFVPIGDPVTPESAMQTFIDTAPPAGKAFYRLQWTP